MFRRQDFIAAARVYRLDVAAGRVSGSDSAVEAGRATLLHELDVAGALNIGEEAGRPQG